MLSLQCWPYAITGESEFRHVAGSTGPCASMPREGHMGEAAIELIMIAHVKMTSVHMPTD